MQMKVGRAWFPLFRPSASILGGLCSSLGSHPGIDPTDTAPLSRRACAPKQGEPSSHNLDMRCKPASGELGSPCFGPLQVFWEVWVRHWGLVPASTQPTPHRHCRSCKVQSVRSLQVCHCRCLLKARYEFPSGGLSPKNSSEGSLQVPGLEWPWNHAGLKSVTDAASTSGNCLRSTFSVKVNTEMRLPKDPKPQTLNYRRDG
jgi:hypothetical protein